MSWDLIFRILVLRNFEHFSTFNINFSTLLYTECLKSQGNVHAKPQLPELRVHIHVHQLPNLSDLETIYSSELDRQMCHWYIIFPLNEDRRQDLDEENSAQTANSDHNPRYTIRSSDSPETKESTQIFKIYLRSALVAI